MLALRENLLLGHAAKATALTRLNLELLIELFDKLSGGCFLRLPKDSREPFIAPVLPPASQPQRSTVILCSDLCTN